MLLQLRLNSFAIFSACELSFSEGFTVFTGETGAGKSLLVDALSLLLGKTASEDWISSSSESALIEAIFQVPEGDSFSCLEPYLESHRELILLRKLQRSKSSVCRVNGQTVSLKELKRISSLLFTIIGQHEYMDLMDSKFQLKLLDAFLKPSFSALFDAYSLAYDSYRSVLHQVNALVKDDSDLLRRVDFLRYQLEELSQKSFEETEEDALKEKKKLIQQKDQVVSSLEGLDQALTRISECHSEMYLYLKKLKDNHVDGFSVLDAQLDEMSRSLEGASSFLYQKHSEWGSKEACDIDALESQLDYFFRLKQKYRVNSLSELLAFKLSLQEEYDRLISSRDTAELLTAQLESLKAQVLALSFQLHQERKQAASHLSQLVSTRLEALSFTAPFFDIQVSFDESSLGESGGSSCVWLVSLNPGQSPKPVHKVASGGELSRLMLAIRSVLLESVMPPTFIFDEVDTGIGGLTANTVGEFLKEISKKSQVLCVTHLPQIAHLSDTHVLVEKSLQNRMMHTEARVLTFEEKTRELSRMLGGDSVLSSLRA